MFIETGNVLGKPNKMKEDIFYFSLLMNHLKLHLLMVHTEKTVTLGRKGLSKFKADFPGIIF